MNDSILLTIKKLLGITPEYEHFDQDLIIHINTAFAVLTQLGVGPIAGYCILDKNDTWSDFLSNNQRIQLEELIKSFIYFKVRLCFDPPTSQSTIDAMNRQLTELEWRINIANSTLAFL